MTRILLLTLAACGAAEVEDEADQAQGPPGAITVNPTTLEFGQIQLQGQASADFAIENQGQGDLTVYDVQFEDDTLRPHWTLQGGMSGVLEPAGEVTIGVLAHPRHLDDVNARLKVLSDDPDNPVITVLLRAEVYGVPEARLDPTGTVSFESTAVGDSSTEMVHIANDGTADLDIEAVALAGVDGPFSIVIDPTGTAVRPQSEDGLVQLRFAPTEAGAYTDSLTIQTNDPADGQITVTVSGVGTAE